MTREAYMRNAAALIAAASPEQRARALKIIDDLRKRPDGVELWLKLGKQRNPAPQRMGNDES